MYLTYEEYKAMGGTLEETPFNNFAFDAESLINWYTFNRLVNMEVSDTVKMLTFRLIDLEASEASVLPTPSSGGTGGVGGSIMSQSNDGFSTSYNTLSASEATRNIAAKKKELINRYLAPIVDSLGRKVLYRGLYPNE